MERRKQKNQKRTIRWMIPTAGSRYVDPGRKKESMARLIARWDFSHSEKKKSRYPRQKRTDERLRFPPAKSKRSIDFLLSPAAVKRGTVLSLIQEKEGRKEGESTRDVSRVSGQYLGSKLPRPAVLPCRHSTPERKFQGQRTRATLSGVHRQNSKWSSAQCRVYIHHRLRCTYTRMTQRPSCFFPWVVDKHGICPRSLSGKDGREARRGPARALRLKAGCAHLRTFYQASVDTPGLS